MSGRRSRASRWRRQPCEEARAEGEGPPPCPSISCGALASRVENRLGEDARAVVAPLGRLEAVREADEVLAAAVDEEGRPRRDLHARFHGALRETRRVGPGRQLDPDEESALGLADLHV